MGAKMSLELLFMGTKMTWNFFSQSEIHAHIVQIVHHSQRNSNS